MKWIQSPDGEEEAGENKEERRKQKKILLIFLCLLFTFLFFSPQKGNGQASTDG